MNRIKELRKKKGVTQEKLAQALSISQANLSGWELEKWQPDQNAIIQMARYFGVTIDYLLGVSEAPYGEKATYNIELAPEEEDERKLLDIYRQVKQKGGYALALKFLESWEIMLKEEK